MFTSTPQTTPVSLPHFPTVSDRVERPTNVNDLVTPLAPSTSPAYRMPVLEARRRRQTRRANR